MEFQKTKNETLFSLLLSIWICLCLGFRSILSRIVFGIKQLLFVNFSFDNSTGKVAAIESANRLLGSFVVYKLDKYFHEYFSVILFTLLLLIDQNLFYLSILSTLVWNLILEYSH